jgi:hypothetical protein
MRLLLRTGPLLLALGVIGCSQSSSDQQAKAPPRQPQVRPDSQKAADTLNEYVLTVEGMT